MNCMFSCFQGKSEAVGRTVLAIWLVYPVIFHCFFFLLFITISLISIQQLDIPKALMVLEIIYPAWFLFEIQFILLDCILLRISFSSLLKKWVLEYKCLRACTKLLFRYNFHTISKCNGYGLPGDKNVTKHFT